MGMRKARNPTLPNWLNSLLDPALAHRLTSGDGIPHAPVGPLVHVRANSLCMKFTVTPTVLYVSQGCVRERPNGEGLSVRLHALLLAGLCLDVCLPVCTLVRGVRPRVCVCVCICADLPTLSWKSRSSALPQ
jgi:hypothetical protein